MGGDGQRVSNHVPKTFAPAIYLGPHFPGRIDERPDFTVLLR